jgi:hypothetical protein
LNTFISFFRVCFDYTPDIHTLLGTIFLFFLKMLLGPNSHSAWRPRRRWEDNIKRDLH